MPDFYSEAEATTYEVIFGAAFEVESHWRAGTAPPRVPGAPPSLQPIKAPVPTSAATGHLHLPTGLGAGEAHWGRASAAQGEGWFGGPRYPGDGTGQQVSAWTPSQKGTKTVELDGLESGHHRADYLRGEHRGHAGRREAGVLAATSQLLPACHSETARGRESRSGGNRGPGVPESQRSQGREGAGRAGGDASQVSFSPGWKTAPHFSTETRTAPPAAEGPGR